MKQQKLFWGSSYDRGLDILLNMWPNIKLTVPEATLDICYGWDLFDKVSHNNPERVMWKEKMVELMKQPGITEHGRLSKEALRKLRSSSGIWAYPTNFTEINCITALECQSDGVVPVTMDYAALSETVGAGIKVVGDIFEQLVKDDFVNKLTGLMQDPEKWKYYSTKGKAFAKNYHWNTIADQWTREFRVEHEDIKVTIVTPTIRKGFWNIMADNIANQTHKNIEWVIVDDFEKDRRYQADKMAKKYRLDVKYLRGKERALKRTYGLVNANNTGLQNATGDLIVILQDFVMMPIDGVEQLVILHKKNPDCLLAPVDMYMAPKMPPKIDQEDWFDGELDVYGEFIRQSIRIQNKGLRFTENPYDFEQNYGAIPTKIAKALGGWYEFYDEGLGYDNTDIALRALLSGYKIILDETNIAVCIDHWEALKHTRENVIGRARRLNDPRYVWASEMLDAKKLPLVRTQEVDDKIELLYDIPDSVTDEDIVKWVKENVPQVVAKWLEEVKI